MCVCVCVCGSQHTYPVREKRSMSITIIFYFTIICRIQWFGYIYCISTLMDYLIPNILYISSSSWWRAACVDFPDRFLPHVPIIHRSI